MNNAVIVQQADSGFIAMLNLTAELHQAYAKRHRMDLVTAIVDSAPNHVMGWSRWPLLEWALWRYEYVFWIDADAAIVGDDDLRMASAADIGLTWGGTQGEPPHHNVGVMYLRSAPGVHYLAQKLIAETPSETPESMFGPWHGPVGRRVCDQALINELAQVDPWKLLFGTVGTRWNSIECCSRVANPVVMAWHGTPAGEKLSAMERAKQRGWVWP